MEKLLSTFPISAYGLIVACALLVWLLFSLRAARIIRKTDENSGITTGVVLALFAASVPSGLAFARLFWCAANYKEFITDPVSILYIHKGGLSLWGFLLGFRIAAGLYSLALYANAKAALDAFAPGLLIFICIIRAAEILTGQGSGIAVGLDILKNPVFSMVRNSETVYAVYRFEAVWALICAIAALWFFKKRTRAFISMKGDVWKLSILGYAAMQTVFEAMSLDDRMMYKNINLSFALSVLAAFLMIIGCMVRLQHYRRLKAHALWILLLQLGGAFLTVFGSYRLETSLFPERELLIILAGAVCLLLPALFVQPRLLRAQIKKDKRLRKRRTHSL